MRSATASAVGASSVAGHLAVGQEHDAVGVRGGDGVVGHHDDGLAGRVDDLAQQRRGPRGRCVVSSAPVGSSANRTSGRVTSARAIATRCCWPPDSSRGTVAQPVGQARALARPRASSRGRGVPAEPHREADVLLDRQRRHQVEGLEDEPDALAAQHGQRRLRQPGEVHAAEPARALGRRVEPGGDVQERALARPDGPMTAVNEPCRSRARRRAAR